MKKATIRVLAAGAPDEADGADVDGGEPVSDADSYDHVNNLRARVNNQCRNKLARFTSKGEATTRKVA